MPHDVVELMQNFARPRVTGPVICPDDDSAVLRHRTTYIYSCHNRNVQDVHRFLIFHDILRPLAESSTRKQCCFYHYYRVVIFSLQ